MQLCNWDENEPTHYKNALEEIKSIIYSESFNRWSPITLILAKNYLEDDGIRDVCEFIQSHEILKKNLKVIDISKNCLTPKSLKYIKTLLNYCSLEHLNLSINYLTVEDVSKRMGDAYYSGIVKISVI